MIRLATCFSGIGAIEHALNRMGLDNKIVFACDNGDVDILSKSVPVDIEEIKKEFTLLEKIIRGIESSEDAEELKSDLDHDAELFENQCQKIELVDATIVDLDIFILQQVIEMKEIKKARLKEYTKFLDSLKKQKGNNLLLHGLMYAIEILNDYHKDNSWSLLEKTDAKFNSGDKIDWSLICSDLVKLKKIIDKLNGRKILKNTRDISERLGMLHEKIQVLQINNDLNKLSSYDEKKAYIDSLYASKESSNNVKKSYMANYDLDDRHFYWNVSFLDGKEYTNEVDLFVGGSPCQSFSLVGKQRGLEDTRGTLFYEYARLVKEIKPKVFIYENVKAILSNDDGRTWETICQVFTDLDYTWSYQVLNARDYGIPQNRERVFVVGFRNDLKLKKKFEFPKPIELKTTMKDFLLDNVSGKYYLPSKGVDFVTSDKNLTKRYTQIDGDVALCQKKNQQFNWHGDFVFEEENKDKEKTMQDLEKYFLSEKVRKYVLASGTKGFYSRPETDLDIARPLLTTMHKMHRAGVDNYVTTDGRLRKLTPRECLRLMGFSDSFKIVVSDTSMYQQSGNSIVVDVLMNIMNQVIESYPQLLEEEENGGK
jgi:DNA (cytosine-5)-methyltransferase 1